MTNLDIQTTSAAVLRKYGATEAYLFGSRARGTAAHNSDIDILARFPQLGGLFRYMKIKLELEQSLGARVDLVQIEALDERMRERVMRDAVPVM